MRNNLITLALIASLSACGGSSSSNDDTVSNDDDSVVVTNTAASITGDLTGDVVKNGTATSSGSVTIVDPDVDENQLTVISSASTDYGTFSVTSTGSWTYELDNTNTAVQALSSSETLTDTITMTSVDGTEKNIVITITGVDDIVVPTPNTVATFSGDLTGAITEDDTASITGTVTVVDPDTNENTLVEVIDLGTTYGTFSMTTAGVWTYALDNTNAAVQALNASATLIDTIAITSTDGTPSNVVVTITGIDDVSVPVISSGTDGVDAASVDATTSTAPVAGTLAITGVTSFVEQTATQGTYGTFSIDSTGAWTYELDATATTTSSKVNASLTSTNSATISANLNAISSDVTDTFAVEGDNGTFYEVSITISGITPSTGSGLIKGSIGDNDTVPDINCTTTVSSTSALESAVSFDMTPGETICLAAGDYDGLELEFGGAGTDTLPITVAAAVPGEVTISGDIQVAMTGTYSVLQGFIFKDGSVDNTIIVTRANSNTPCNFCRITENSVINMENDDTSSRWVQIFGSNNRVDHNWFSGKDDRGVLLEVERSDEQFGEDGEFEVDFAQIDHNYFGDRPPVFGAAYADASDNEYEVIRLGVSFTHTADSSSIVEHNYFEGINAEPEVISNKSGNNIIRHNTIRDSRGSIVTRHGENAVIENNFIFGDDNPFSGGLRIVDSGHTVTNNYIEGARYADSNWNGGIIVSSSNGSTSNGYQDVEDVLIAHNTIVDSVNSLNFFGGNQNSNPETVYFVNNIVADAIGAVIRNGDELPSSSIFSENYVYGQTFSDDDDLTALSGFNIVDAALEKGDDGLYRPSTNSPDLSADTNPYIDEFTLPTVDMDGQTRSDATISGADETLTSTITRAPLTAALVGPLSYTPPAAPRHINKVELSNHDFDSGDFTGWVNSGADIITDKDETFSRGVSVKFDDVTDVISQVVTVEEDTEYTFSAFMKGNGILAVEVGGVLHEGTNGSSKYSFTSVNFNSGSNTSVTLMSMMNPQVTNNVSISNDSFDDGFDSWVQVEPTDGDLGTSGNSSDDDGSSIQMKRSSGAGGTENPSVAQTVTVQANAEYTLSTFNLLKSAQSGSSVVFGVYTENESIPVDDATILASKDSVYADLENSDALEGEDDFFQDTLTFNSGDNTELTIFAQLNSTTGDTLRIDEFELSSFGAPSDGSEVFVDSFRLVSHLLSEAETLAAREDN